MAEYLGRAIDILCCHYTDICSERGDYQTYTREQVLWALETVMPVLIAKQNEED